MSFCQPVHIKSHKLNFRFNALTNFLKDGPIRPSYEYMYEKSIPPFDDVASACNTMASYATLCVVFAPNTSFIRHCSLYLCPYAPFIRRKYHAKRGVQMSRHKKDRKDF